MIWSENTEQFLKYLNSGYGWQFYVWSFLRMQKLDVGLEPYAFRESIEQADDFKDEPDITFFDRHIEVKSRKLAFTVPSDFPYRTVIIDTVSGHKKKKRKPSCHICVSRKTGGMIVLSKRTRKHWVKEERFDADRRIYDWFFECDQKLWVPIEQLVENMVKAQEDMTGENQEEAK